MKGESCNVCGEIRYHDYVALLCHLDAAPAVSPSPLGADICSARKYLLARNDFVGVCREYRDCVQSNYGHYYEVNRVRGRKCPALAPELYSPMCYATFGESDELTVTLLDDLEPMISITGDLKSSVAQATPAFCPRLDFLGKERLRGGVFRELHELVLMTSPSGGRETSKPGTMLDVSHPLVVLTQYKINAVATLSLGLQAQIALYRAMAKQIEDTLADLRGLSNTNCLVDEEDTANVYCAFLDTQGPEEIATLVFGRNYTVAMAIVAAIRQLTVEDLCNTSPGLRERFADSGLVQALQTTGFGPTGGRTPDASLPCCIRNHAFSWTRSTLGVSHHALLDPLHENCRGFVNAQARISVRPGHDAAVDQCHAGVAEAFRGATVRSFSGSPRDSYLFAVGAHDRVVPYAADATDKTPAMVPVGTVIDLTKHIVSELCSSKATAHDADDITDVLTLTAVPVPRITRLAGGPVDNGHWPLGLIITRTQERLFGTSSPRNSRTGDAMALNEDALRSGLRVLRVPYALRRAIVFTYREYAQCLGDGRLYDSVLDLHDVFATLHSLLSYHLPQQQARTPEDRRPSLFMEPESIAELSAFVGALRNSLTHRIHIALPDLNTRDIAIDLRGGLNQLVAASDVPLKCGVGFLYWTVYNSPVGHGHAPSGETPRTVRPYHLVGIVNRVALHPFTACRRLPLGRITDACLAYSEMCLTQLIDPSGFADFLHEASHLVFPYLLTEGYLNPRILDEESPTSHLWLAMEQCLEEVFALLVTHILLFDTDTELFLKYYLSRYSANPTSFSRSRAKVLLKFMETMLRAFVVTRPIRSLDIGSGDQWPEEMPGGGADQEGLTSQELTAATAEFLSFIEQHAWLFSEYGRLWHGPSDAKEEVLKFCTGQFREDYPRLLREMPQIWQWAVTLCKTYQADRFPYSRELGFDHRESVRTQVQKAFNDGRPLIRSLYRDSRLRHSEESNADDQGLDALFMVSEVLREHLRRCYGILSPDKRLFLYRRSDDGEADYARGGHDEGRKWNEFQIDSGFAGLFCADGEARRRRLTWHICAIKTLWDISTTLKARRLTRMIRDCWGGSARD